jgi:hypothetical protein
MFYPTLQAIINILALSKLSSGAHNAEKAIQSRYAANTKDLMQKHSNQPTPAKMLLIERKHVSC